MRILVFQHLPIEHPGVLRDFWREAGHERTIVELDAGESIPDLEPYDLLVVMGGPMDVWEADRHPWLVPEQAAIRHWVRELRRPFLGICLGHQLLATALGGGVSLMAKPEVGLASVDLTKAGKTDPMTARLGSSFRALHWHGAEVSRLPDGAVALASTAACPVQAMRWGSCAYGFQCHIEITAATVPEWREIPAYRASLEAVLGTDGAAQLQADVEREIDALSAVARRANEAFFRLIAGTMPTLV